MSGIGSVTAFLPSATSGVIFSTRRCNSGANAVAENNNLAMGVSNGMIASGQARNVAVGLSSIAHASNSSIANEIISAENSIKNMAKSNKFLSGAGEVLKFVGNNINPIIVATGGISVLTAKDKEDEFKTQALALPTMFAAEATAKRLIGLPINKDYDKKIMTIEDGNLYKNLEDGTKQLLAKKGHFEIINDKTVSIKRDGLYKKIPFMGMFIEKQVDAINDYCKTKTILKSLPSVVKGLMFVVASICGYQTGLKLKNVFFEKSNAESA